MSQMHPIGALMPHAKRYHKIQNFLRGNCCYTLWWTFPNSSILSKDQNQMVSPKVYKILPISRTLLYFRINFIHFLLYYFWYITYREYTPIAIQWCVQKTSWSKDFSQSYYYKTVLVSTYPKSYSTDCSSSQFTPTETILYPFNSNKRYIRFRPNSTYSLWQTTKSQGGIQSKEIRQKMLLPVSMFRIQPSRVLAWEIKFWEYPSCNFSNTFPERMHSQIAKDRKKNSYPNRLCLFQPQVYRILRKRRNRLYNRSKSHQPDTRNNSEKKISPLQKGLGSSRVLLSANDSFPYQVEKDPSFCSPTSPIAGRAGRNSPTKSFYNKRIWLQSSCNQSEIETQTCLELPQSESKRCRTEYQRAKTQLSINKDSNSELYGKCCLSSNASILIQYCQLVQTPMSSKRVSIQDIKDYSPGFDIGTNETNNTWTRKYAQVPCWLSISKIILSTYGKDRKYENLKNLSRLENIVSSQTH